VSTVDCAINLFEVTFGFGDVLQDFVPDFSALVAHGDTLSIAKGGRHFD